MLERETQAVISPEKHGGSSHYRINEKQREDTAESTVGVERRPKGLDYYFSNVPRSNIVLQQNFETGEKVAPKIKYI